MKMKIVERTFSGYRLNLPKSTRLFVRTSTERVEAKDLSFWMRQRFSYFQELADEGRLAEVTE